VKSNFMDKQLDRLADAGDFPRVVLVDTVSHCNLRCSMCVHKHMKRKQGVMPRGLFTKIIDEISTVDKTIRVWMVFFGEALLLKKTKPSIFDLIQYAKSKGLTDVVMNSNGNLLDEKAARALIDSGLDAVYFGIDAFREGTYSRIRVGGNYQKTRENVVRLLELQKNLNVYHPKVFVQFVEMDINKDEKEDFVKFWSSHGATVKIRPKVSWAGEIEAPNLTLGNPDRWPCHWAMQTMSITDTGKVVTCAVDLEAKFIAGDVNSQSLSGIWNSTLKQLRNCHVLKTWEHLPPHCRDCRDWQSARAEYRGVKS
jgi:radical SAM protein with 4Fe4S-binding SPASM domain